MPTSPERCDGASFQEVVSRATSSADPSPLLSTNLLPPSAYLPLGLGKLADVLDPQRLRFYRAGAEVDTPISRSVDRFGELQTALDREALAQELARGGTLVMIEIQSMIPAELDRLRIVLQDLTDERAWVNAFNSYGTETGIAPHWDDNHVFILQCEGQREWILSEPVVSNPAAGMEQPSGHTGRPMRATLGPGDLLFVPWGWVHSTVPVGPRSTHLMFAYRPRTGLDYFRWLLPRLASADACRAPIADGDARGGAETLALALREAFERHDIATFLTSRKTQRPDAKLEDLGGMLGD